MKMTTQTQSIFMKLHSEMEVSGYSGKLGAWST